MSDLRGQEVLCTNERSRLRYLRRITRRRNRRDKALADFLKEAEDRYTKRDMGPFAKMQILREIRRVQVLHMNHDTDDEGDDMPMYNLA